MLAVEEDRLPEAQTQNPAPIPEQLPVPAGAHEEIVLSFDRRKGWMRINIDGQDWWFKSMYGSCQITGADNPKGRLYLRGYATIMGDQLSLHRAKDAVPHPLITGDRLNDTFNRMCYRRYEGDGARATRGNWRLRDERLTRKIYQQAKGTEKERWAAAMNHPDTLRLVDNIVGDARTEWPTTDIVAHCFTHGFAVIDPKTNWAHLYDTEL